MPKMGFSSSAQSAQSIAFVAFNKHIADEITQRLQGSRTLFEGSDEQEAIWHEALNGSRHIMVNAVAGSGKTSTGLQYIYRTKANVQAMTYHSLGLRALRQAFKQVDVDQYKVDGVIEEFTLPVESSLERTIHGHIKQVVGLAKQYGKDEREDIARIIDMHDIDLNGHEEVVIEYALRALKRCLEITERVDFDDMVWLPYALNLAMPHYDVMIQDESQDMSTIQQWGALRSADRLMVVGDRNQAIYAWRGADSNSMDTMKAALMATSRGVVELPLTLTRRCPKSHVRLAQTIVPQIQAMPDAPEGKIRYMTLEDSIRAMMPGDLVLCRVNADLLSVAYRLLRRKVPAVVRGRDIGMGLKRLIEKCEKRGKLKVMDADLLLKFASEVTQEDVRKFNAMPNGRGQMRAAAAVDRYECMAELAREVRDSRELKALIEKLFSDQESAGKVVLGTVHRTKGLESSRVFVLRPELLPHPMAKREEERRQELNIAYIAVTRAKYGDGQEGELVFIGKESPLFGGMQ